MSEFADLVLADAQERMDKAIAHTREAFASVRTGRAAPQLVEKLTVEAYGAEVRLVEVASVSIPEARQLTVTPHDPANLEACDRAIRTSDLGIQPSSDGRSLRLNFPPLTDERRKELAKMVGGMAEDGKNSIRNIRREANRDLDAAEKDKQLSADELARAKKDVDKLKQDSEGKISQAQSTKEEELLEV